MPRTYIWSVSGMHCASCERLIAEELRTLPGVMDVDVRLSKRKAGIQVSDDAPEPDVERINQALQPHGYHLALVDPSLSNRSPSYACAVPMPAVSFGRRVLEAILLLVGISLVIRIVQPLATLVPSVAEGSSVIALFFLGAVASVSTCLASTGAFLVAYSAAQTPSRGLLIRLHAGRLVAFLIGGAALGAIGTSLPQAAGFYGWFAIVMGIGFFIVGLHLLNLSPSLGSLGVRLPRRLTGVVDRIQQAKSPWTPFAVGAATFILPCGFTQTAQALALVSGSAFRGAFLLTAFALGTLPVLVGMTSFTSSAVMRHRILRGAAGALLLVFAVGQFDGGLTVLGSSVTVSGLVANARAGLVKAAQPAVVQAQEQIVTMRVAYGAFSPNRFVVKKGVPVRWDVQGVDISGCASTLVAPSIGINQSLRLGLNTFRFTPTRTGSIPFSCSMGMIRGSFTVID